MTADAIAAPLPQSRGERHTKRFARALYVACLLFLVGVPTFLFALKLVIDVFDPYYRPPSPDGMLLRVPIEPAPFPTHHVAVEPAPGGRSAIWIRTRRNGEGGERILEVDVASGATRELDPTFPFAATFTTTAPSLDLDGDGFGDRIRYGGEMFDPTVEVLSGADGSVLFRDLDRFEYAYKERAFPLGDLDGDGFGELALVHPRDSRSYDFHPANLVHDVRGWVTVVSGARLAR